jgi:2-octaprenyl-6-methoxyphenol hydroxylase
MIKNYQDTYRVDILIVGSGVVGCSLAIALSNVGLTVAIVDKLNPLVQTGVEFDGRASAIAATPQKMLNQIGVWQMLEKSITPIKDIRVVDGDSSFFLHYSHQDVDCEALGYMVENRHFRQACLTKIQNSKNIYFIAPAQIKQIKFQPHEVNATLTNSVEIDASLVVGADGRASNIRQIAGISCVKRAYSQTAIVLSVNHDLPHNNTAYERFLPGGPFAILPLSTNQRKKFRSSIVWTEETALAEIILKLSPRDFLNEFKLRFGDHLGKFEFFGPREAYPLSLQYAETFIANRIALVGDAAHGIHPIAGQGLNLGLRDVATLAELLVDSKRLGIDIGNDILLQNYQKWRRFDSSTMLAITDSLNRIFSNDISPIKLARNFGLTAINKIDPVKKFFMLQAMGAAGDLPRLLKGEAL